MRFLLLLLCVSLDACSPPHEPAAPAPQQEPAPQLQYAGCLRVEAPDIHCELTAERHLTLWCSSATVELQASSEHAPLALTRSPDPEQGARYTLDVPAGVRKLTLRAGTTHWSLQLADPLDDAALAQARALRQRGDLDAARDKLLVAAPQLSAALQRRAQAELARIALQQADYADAAARLERSFQSALQLGRVSEAIADGTAWSFVLTTNLRRFEQTRAVLTRLEILAERDDSGRALLPHYAGVLALETGDLRQGLRLFRDAIRATARLGLQEHELLAREQEAWALSLLGQHAAAIAAQRVLAEQVRQGDACQRADRYESVVWYALLARAQRGSEMFDSAREYSERAQAQLQHCTSPWRQRNHQINAGLLALQSGDLAATQAHLQALAAIGGVDDPVLEAWELLLRGRHALQAGAAELAESTFRQALATCQRHGLWEPEQLAQLGIARTLQALRRPAAALSAYREAEASLERSLFRVPLAEGLGGARHAREAGTHELMALLLQQDDAAGALAVARRARARGLMLLAAQERVPSLSQAARGRWERLLARYHASREQAASLRESAWQLPRERAREREAEIARHQQSARQALDEAYGLVLSNAWTEEPMAAWAVAPEPPGRATLALFASDQVVHGFVFGCGPVRSRELRALRAGADAAEQAQAWLLPFSADLACASELRVIAPAGLSSLDVSAWQLDGQPVVERWAVSYALDVPQRTAAAPQQGTLRVVDPRADLPLAAREAEVVLPRAFAPVRERSRDAAQRGELLRELPGLALFHFAGHHRFAGAEGSESELVLADGTLSVGDVLTLSAAPRFVVLTACESARLEAPGFSAGLDLAYAFILNGSRAVIAASRPVPDALGYAISAALYAELPPDASNERELVKALQAAQLRVRREQPASDWSAFRVITR